METESPAKDETVLRSTLRFILSTYVDVESRKSTSSITLGQEFG